MQRERRYCGFTLVELLAATVIGVLVIIAAIVTSRSVSQSRRTARYYSDMMAQGRYALDYIRDDLANFSWSSDREKMLFVGTQGGTIQQPMDQLKLYVVSNRPLKARMGESGIYEVEYGLNVNKGTQESSLLRRCAIVTDPAQGNPSGMLVQIAEQVRSLKLEYFDGTNWQRQWQSRRSGLPRLIRVSIILASERDDYNDLKLSQEVALEALPIKGEG